MKSLHCSAGFVSSNVKCVLYRNVITKDIGLYHRYSAWQVLFTKQRNNTGNVRIT